MKRMDATRKFTALIFIFVLSVFTIIPATTVKSQDLNEINVLLLNGKSDYEQSLTMNNSKGLRITTNHTVPFSSETQGNERIGFQFDRFFLQVLETTDINQAKTTVEQITGIKEPKLSGNIEVFNKNNQTYYRVIAGGASTIEQLKEVQTLIASEFNLTGKIMGAYHLSAGTFNDSNTASEMVTELSKKGFVSYMVYVQTNDKWTIQVWTGESAGDVEIEQLKASLSSSFPNINFTESQTKSYVIEKESLSYYNGTWVKHRFFVFSAESVVNVQSLDEQSAIQIKERLYQGDSNQYHGSMKLLLDNGNLSIVNRLPLESYLYSVVASEMYSSFPLEALKAQAVAARTFAYQKLLNPRSAIAHIYDTVADQAYYGTSGETELIRQAVDLTKGIVIISEGQPITSFYSSNAGGITSAGSEVWGSTIPYTSVKASPEDESVLKDTFIWYRIMRSTGETGYIRSDYIQTINKSHPFLNLKYGTVNTENVNFRTGPSTYRFPIITTLPKGEEIVILESVYENNPYSWIAGPFTAEEITQNVNQYQLASASDFTQPILDLKVSQRGPSGRVTLLANGQTSIPVQYPDYYRTMLGGLTKGVQSTLFDIEQTGRIEVLASQNKTSSVVNKKEQIYVQSAEAKVALYQTNMGQQEYFIMGAGQKLRVATKDQKYLLSGKGFGHGIGMSQWGAQGLANSGYICKDILKYYYNNIELKKLY